MIAGPLVLHLRSSLRRNWRSLLAIALLFGLSAGLAVASFASARRTSSAYGRMLEATRASDISIDYGAYDPVLADRMAALPGVVSSGTYLAFNAGSLLDSGYPDPSAPDFETVGSLDGRYFDQDRVTVIRGRLPDPARVDEVAISESIALSSGISVGDRLTLGLVTDAELATADPMTLLPATREPVTVVGEILFADEVIQDDNDVITRMLMTPAFTARHQQAFATYAWQGLRLRPGTAADEVSTSVRELVTASAGDGSGFVLVRDVAEDRARVDRAVLPQVSLLLIMSLLLALVALVLVQQAAVRQLRQMESDLSTYRSFGLGPASLAATAAAPLLMAVGAGAVLAVIVAVTASPLSPVGALHRVETDPGVDLDELRVMGGALALASISCLGIVAAAASAARRAGRPWRSSSSARTSLLAGWAQSAGAPVSVSVGSGYALQPDSGPRAAPVRTIAAGATVAVAALVAALCFGSSLNRLVDNPRLYGWNWDVGVIDESGYGAIDIERAGEALDSDPSVEGWAPLGISSTLIDDATVPIIGVRSQDRVGPAILTGRAVESGDEIVLGRATLRSLGKQVGDIVSVGPVRRPLRIVGTATLPALGQAHSSHPSPGEGAIVFNDFDPSVFNDFDPSDDVAPDESDAPAVVIRLRPGVDADAARQRLRETTFDIGVYPGSSTVLEVSRPAEIINARSITMAPMFVAAVLTLTVFISLSLALVAAVRRRRVDLATLKAIGFTRRQVAATILTQSLVITTVAVLIGTPIGVIAGRWLWTRFAERMSVVNSPSVPIGTLIIVVLALTLGGLLVAVAPSQIASRVRARDALPRD